MTSLEMETRIGRVVENLHIIYSIEKYLLWECPGLYFHAHVDMEVFNILILFNFEVILKCLFGSKIYYLILGVLS